MPSDIALSMMRKRRMSSPAPEPDEHLMDDGDISGHPHQEGRHQEVDRQHAYDQAYEALQSLAKDGMPGADEMSKQLQKSWASWQGTGPKGPGMQPATKMSHRASPVSKSGIDEADEESMYKPDETDVTKDG